MLHTAAVLQVVIALASTSGGDRAIERIGDGLALIEARHRLERIEAASARPTAKKVRVPSAGEIAADPSVLPPASAGSNGTHVPHASSLGRDEIFAHRRGGDSTAILLTGVALRFDTVGAELGTGPRWHLATVSTAGYVARHPPGL